MRRAPGQPDDSTSKPQSASTPLADYLLEFQARAESGFCPGPRYRIGHSAMGAGPPVYVVPGICSTRRQFAPLVVELAQAFRTVVYDLPGVERGDGADLRGYQLDDYPRDLFQLADHLDDREFFVMGLSFGVSIAVRAMVQRPDRVPRAMLISGFARRPLRWLERVSLRAFRYWPGRLRHIPASRLVTRYNHGPELEAREPALVDFLVSQTGQTPTRTAGAQALAIDQSDLRELLPSVRQPVMIVHGREDRLVPTRCAAELADGLGNVRIMLIPGCGHVPHLSHPELLAHAAEKFFRER